MKLVGTHCRYPTKRLLGRQAASVKVRWGLEVPGEQQPKGLAERDRGSEGQSLWGPGRESLEEREEQSMQGGELHSSCCLCSEWKALECVGWKAVVHPDRVLSSSEFHIFFWHLSVLWSLPDSRNTARYREAKALLIQNPRGKLAH